MATLKKLLAPTDFSELSEQGALYACLRCWWCRWNEEKHSPLALAC